MESNEKQVQLKGKVNLLYIRCPLSPVQEQSPSLSDSLPIESNLTLSCDLQHLAAQVCDNQQTFLDRIKTEESEEDISNLNFAETPKLNQQTFDEISRISERPSEAQIIKNIMEGALTIDSLFNKRVVYYSKMLTNTLYQTLVHHQRRKCGTQKLRSIMSRLLISNCQQLFTPERQQVKAIKPIVRLTKQTTSINAYDFRKVRRLYKEMQTGTMLGKTPAEQIDKCIYQEAGTIRLKRLLEQKIRINQRTVLTTLMIGAWNSVKVEEIALVVRNIPKTSNGLLYKCYANLLKIAKEQKLVQDSISEMDLSMISVSSNSIQPPSHFKSKLQSLKGLFQRKNNSKISNKNIHKYLGIEHGLFSLFRVMEGYIVRNMLFSIEEIRQAAQQKLIFISALRNLVNLRHSKFQSKQIKYFFRWKSIIKNDVSQLSSKLTHIMQKKRFEFSRQFMFALTQRCFQQMISKEEKKKQQQNIQVIMNQTRDKTSKQISSFFLLEKSLRKARKLRLEQSFLYVEQHAQYKLQVIQNRQNGIRLLIEVYNNNIKQSFFGKLNAIISRQQSLHQFMKILDRFFVKEQQKLTITSFNKILYFNLKSNCKKLTKFSLNVLTNKFRKYANQLTMNSLLTKYRFWKSTQQSFDRLNQIMISHQQNSIQVVLYQLQEQSYLKDRRTIALITMTQSIRTANLRIVFQRLQSNLAQTNYQLRMLGLIVQTFNDSRLYKMQTAQRKWKEETINLRLQEIYETKTQNLMHRNETLRRIIIGLDSKIKQFIRNRLGHWRRYSQVQNLQKILKLYDNSTTCARQAQRKQDLCQTFAFMMRVALKRSIHCSLRNGFEGIKQNYKSQQLQDVLIHKVEQMRQQVIRVTLQLIGEYGDKRKLQLQDMKYKIMMLQSLKTHQKLFNFQKILKSFMKNKFQQFRLRQQYELATNNLQRVLTKQKKIHNHVNRAKIFEMLNSPRLRVLAVNRIRLILLYQFKRQNYFNTFNEYTSRLMQKRRDKYLKGMQLVCLLFKKSLIRGKHCGFSGIRQVSISFRQKRIKATRNLIRIKKLISTFFNKQVTSQFFQRWVRMNSHCRQQEIQLNIRIERIVHAARIMIHTLTNVDRKTKLSYKRSAFAKIRNIDLRRKRGLRKGIQVLELILLNNLNITKSQGFTSIKLYSSFRKSQRLIACKKTLLIRHREQQKALFMAFQLWKEDVQHFKEEFEMSMNIQSLRNQIDLQCDLLSQSDIQKNYIPFEPLKIEHCIQTTQHLQPRRYRQICLSGPLEMTMGTPNSLRSTNSSQTPLCNPVPLVPLEHELSVKSSIDRGHLSEPVQCFDVQIKGNMIKQTNFNSVQYVSGKALTVRNCASPEQWLGGVKAGNIIGSSQSIISNKTNSIQFIRQPSNLKQPISMNKENPPKKLQSFVLEQSVSLRSLESQTRHESCCKACGSSIKTSAQPSSRIKQPQPSRGVGNDKLKYF